ncbi:MAG: response regulator receiver protein [Verrucomicrobia bacterium]|nr:response regulator receiver protein [Verrucomicrobiota bacterium]
MTFAGTILLVDDEAHIRKFVGMILKQLSAAISLIEASNGAEALVIYERDHPDLVLLDVNMPVMDGIETLRALRNIDPACVVVMLTSLANRKTVEETVELGAAGYILKDTPKEEIARALSDIIHASFEIGGPTT